MRYVHVLGAKMYASIRCVTGGAVATSYASRVIPQREMPLRYIHANNAAGERRQKSRGGKCCRVPHTRARIPRRQTITAVKNRLRPTPAVYNRRGGRGQVSWSVCRRVWRTSIAAEKEQPSYSVTRRGPSIPRTTVMSVCETAYKVRRRLWRRALYAPGTRTTCGVQCRPSSQTVNGR